MIYGDNSSAHGYTCPQHSEYAFSKEQTITRHGENKGKEFDHCFKLAKSRLENEEDLEKIIEEWYYRLIKKLG
ncbi:MAG: hypothetical protein OEY22_04085 [Candidatus Bathyarchaeota archaeon]|nr:hypothetical protein [Candidatus Bathyarchaeota archaeon]MDH5788610.1 hypothetical protein [Candidatus Bathyarchaeota archaeon]